MIKSTVQLCTLFTCLIYTITHLKQVFYYTSELVFGWIQSSCFSCSYWTNCDMFQLWSTKSWRFMLWRILLILQKKPCCWRCERFPGGMSELETEDNHPDIAVENLDTDVFDGASCLFPEAGDWYLDDNLPDVTVETDEFDDASKVSVVDSSKVKSPWWRRSKCNGLKGFIVSLLWLFF